MLLAAILVKKVSSPVLHFGMENIVIMHHTGPRSAVGNVSG